MESNWSNDLIVENSIRDYYTVPRLWNTIGTVEVVNDLDRQYHGMDVICNGKSIDEKCSTYNYVNMDPPTWLLEIGVPKKKNPKELTYGWSIDDKKVNDACLLMSISQYIGQTYNNGIVIPKNPKIVPMLINELYCILEKKSVATEFVCNKCHLSKEDLWNIACDMHQKGKQEYWISGNIKIMKVTSNKEQAYIIPLKMVYHREVADKIFRINRYGGIKDA